MHSERLVERLPDGGYVPTASNLVEVRQLYEVRRALELATLHRPVETGEPHDPAVVEPLRDDWLVLRRDTPEPDPGFVLPDSAPPSGSTGRPRSTSASWRPSSVATSTPPTGNSRCIWGNPSPSSSNGPRRP
ncbi:hypothetical protein O7543_27880 [Solwaraspora sp. WMMA2080]|uniref:hypothetical protein n=1 Tax=unclassified Solwaraspora TaxID=2627926 RepID=UPI00248C2CBC|nr:MULTISPECIES: hypothetical protein [unclassified Solwaraspora]WBB95554.1 hypothetical protein O7553_19485 [Solwaraspora sp. WMMA2059]WBC20541.1 hypothetical protein O7543_27880 [Solwaraspora sp. WMMA2080]